MQPQHWPHPSWQALENKLYKLDIVTYTIQAHIPTHGSSNMML